MAYSNSLKVDRCRIHKLIENNTNKTKISINHAHSPPLTTTYFDEEILIIVGHQFSFDCAIWEERQLVDLERLGQTPRVVRHLSFHPGNVLLVVALQGRQFKVGSKSSKNEAVIEKPQLNPTRDGGIFWSM